jgi:hypothetical protein
MPGRGERAALHERPDMLPVGRSDVLAVRATSEAPAAVPLGCPVPDDCRGLPDRDDPDVVMIIVTGDAAGVNAGSGQVDLLISEARLGFSDGELQLSVDQRRENFPGVAVPG